MTTDHDLVDALKRCEGDLAVVLEELRVRGAPEDAREVVERWRRRMLNSDEETYHEDQRHPPREGNRCYNDRAE